MKEWKIQTDNEERAYGRCSIKFTPLAKEEFGFNYLVSVKKYKIIFGHFRGWVVAYGST